MDLRKVIAELEAERDRLDQAIAALERLSAGQARKPGRPAKWLRVEAVSDRVKPAQKTSPSNGVDSLALDNDPN